ncbi:MAG: CheR family methyltransferase [Pseudomonadota bacterium]
MFRELLIGVTNFFRDAESFNVLKTSVLPELLKQMKEDDTFRAWIPGCSTGEEVYSLVIVLRELLDNYPKRINLQLFGTDIDKFAIDKAREGLYPSSIITDMSEERVNRFFNKEGDFLRIRKETRDCVVFSVQDLTKDPPFSKLNMLCCRNLLIYLDTPMQRKLLPLFHYTLKPDGILVLGSSETIGGFTNLFTTLDKKWKIFSRLEVPNALRQLVDFPSGLPTTGNGQETVKITSNVQKSDVIQITQKVILDQFAPTAILIDGNGEILHIQGRTGKYLEAVSGPPTRNILDLAREGLRIELSATLRAAKTSNKKITRKKISIKTNGDTQLINLHVCPQRAPKELAGRFLVVFEDIEVDPVVPFSDQGSENSSLIEGSKIEELEKELQINRESHQTTIEELESSNEELKSTNEEMQSSNEELQSTNEELESSKEELQSLNEELQTVNAELQSKVDELSDVQDDMKNLLNSTEIATIFVDNDMRVRRFTHKATTIVNFIPTDVGRPLKHVVNNLTYDGMITDLDEVLRKLTSKETEVQTTDGKWYRMRIMPYRTTDNRIDGGVLTFSSIDEQKNNQGLLTRSSQKYEKAWKLIQAIFDMNHEPTAVLDDKGKAVVGNTAFSNLMDLREEQIEGLDMLASKIGIPKTIGLKSKLKNALSEIKDFETGAFVLKTSSNNKKLKIHGRIITQDADSPYRILLKFLEQ